jgi:hypothetical protein
VTTCIKRRRSITLAVARGTGNARGARLVILIGDAATPPRF